MNDKKLILELAERIDALEKRISLLESESVSTPNPDLLPHSGSKKYRYFSDYLYAQNAKTVQLSFSQIEEILKFNLPESAFLYREFWSNTKSHPIALSWMSAGYITVEVNMENRTAVFEKRDREIDFSKTQEHISIKRTYLKSSNKIEENENLTIYAFSHKGVEYRLARTRKKANRRTTVHCSFNQILFEEKIPNGYIPISQNTYIGQPSAILTPGCCCILVICGKPNLICGLDDGRIASAKTFAPMPSEKLFVMSEAAFDHLSFEN